MDESKKNVAQINNPLWSGIIGLLIYIFIRLSPNIDVLIEKPTEHFYIVSAASIIAAIFAIIIGISGMRLRNLQVIFISLAFISLTVFFSLHGLSTPGFLLPFTHVVGISVQLSFLLMSFWMWLSSQPSDLPIIKFIAGIKKYLVVGYTVILLLLSTLFFIRPELLNFIPIDESPISYFIAGVSITWALLSSFRYWQSYLYSRFPFQLGLSHIAVLIGVAQFIASTGTLWKTSWWYYHFILLIALFLVVISMINQFSLSRSLKGAISGLFSVDPVERLEAGISPQVQALISATEIRDPYTAGHSFRVALGSVQFGIELGLKPEQLRALAQGGILHDIGKLNVPENILNKPSKFDIEDYKIIQQHTVAGHEMCKRLGFMIEELEIIRFHHERYDGKGYPDQLDGESIPFLARLLSIVDVYDALTSDRIYRPALSVTEAREILKKEMGKSFAPNLLTKWLNLTTKNYE